LFHTGETYYDAKGLFQSLHNKGYEIFYASNCYIHNMADEFAIKKVRMDGQKELVERGLSEEEALEKYDELFESKAGHNYTVVNLDKQD